MTIFSTTRPLEEVLETSLIAEFYEFLAGNIVYVPLMDEPGLSFRFKHLENVTGKKTNEDLKKDLIKVTGGHGKLTRIAHEAILSDLLKARRLDDLSEFLMSKNSIKGALYEVWSFLTPEEKIDIKERSQNEFLEKVNIISGKKITIPLFAEFVKTFSTNENSGKLTFDPLKNEITKGQESLTDKLTPSEFRLLKFLIINKDRVCEKDEIIINVWKDSKSQEGVTDQALDQIVYRLRKKIEEDPNNPKYIQTIKGRGYKFNE